MRFIIIAILIPVKGQKKVIELTKILASYCYSINLHIVPLPIFKWRYMRRPHEELTIIMRRVMMQINEKMQIKPVQWR